MNNKFLFAAFCLVVVWPATAAAQTTGTIASVTRASANGKSIPKFTQVEEVVRRHFAAIDGYRAGDIICAGDVQPLIKQFNLLGWRSGGFRSLMAKLPQDDSFLVRTLRTDRGRKFMRQVASFPMAYDRLDRLTAIPSGRKLLNDLIRTKGGYEMIEYMTTSRGGKNLGKQLSNVPNGTDFNQPTGDIYTELQLVEALHALYLKAVSGAQHP